ncbi:MAG: hypothetical protein ISR72_09680 [Methylobacter sp.]|nr:hypothetical protein [Methylobacter sp.]
MKKSFTPESTKDTEKIHMDVVNADMAGANICPCQHDDFPAMLHMLTAENIKNLLFYINT